MKDLAGMPYGIALAGGGFKGLLHTAVLHGLRLSRLDARMRGPLQCAVGCSAGAIVAYLLSIGMKPIEIFGRVVASRLPYLLGESRSYLNLIGGRGLLDWAPVADFLCACTLEFTGTDTGAPDASWTFRDHFESTGVTFLCVVTNFTTARPEYWSHRTHPDTHVLEAIRISCSHPLLYPPVYSDGTWWGDGSILDSFGFRYAVQHFPALDWVGLAVSKPPPAPGDSPWTIPRLLEYMEWIHHCVADPTYPPDATPSRYYLPWRAGEVGANTDPDSADPEGHGAGWGRAAASSGSRADEWEIFTRFGIVVDRPRPRPAIGGPVYLLVRCPTFGLTVTEAPASTTNWFELFFAASRWAHEGFDRIGPVSGLAKAKTD